MAYSHQFIGFGNGKDGDLSYGGGSLGGVAGFGVGVFTGTAGNNYGTFTDHAYFNGTNGGRIGDFVIIHQSVGSGVGQWEVKKVINRSGSTIYFDSNLAYTYSAGAQIVSSGQFKNVNLSGTTTQYKNWDGGSGGIIFLVCNGILTVSGILQSIGGVGSASTSIVNGGVGGGYWGGQNRHANAPQQAIQGAGTGGSGGASTAANGNGGGGGYMANNTMGSGGGGGSNGTAGTAGTFEGSGGVAGVAGNTAGSADLSNMVFGGGGGGGAKDSNSSESSSSGSAGGGIIVLMVKNISVGGAIYTYGGAQVLARWSQSSGAAGAGGSILIKCHNATLGTNLLNANGGASNTGGYGAGGSGRIRIEYLSSLSGSTTPAASAVQNRNLSDFLIGGMI